MTGFIGRPEMAIPATQNTAPVFEYRCLFSHDVRKKKKVWHDGSVKYHTFNKRLMVWDDQKNYIGDSHWRETTDLQEGTEVSLDRGVLVEIGDRIGASVTDLAPLREVVRQHQSNVEGSIHTSNRRDAHPKATGNMATQWRPKPLAAVLGSSQGTLGRARMPTKSPYESRNEIQPNPSPRGPRPAKRPRVMGRRDAGPSIVPQVRGKNLHQNSERTSRAEQAEQVPQLRASPPQAAMIGPESKLQGVVPSTSERLYSRDSVLACPTSGSAGKEIRRRSPKTIQEPTPNSSKQKDCRVPERAEASRRPSLTTLSKRPKTTRLCFAKKIPRSKMMHRGLLAARSSALQDSTAERGDNCHEDTTSGRVKRDRRQSDFSALFSSQDSLRSMRSVQPTIPLATNASSNVRTDGPEAADMIIVDSSANSPRRSSSISTIDQPEVDTQSNHCMDVLARPEGEAIQSSLPLLGQRPVSQSHESRRLQLVVEEKFTEPQARKGNRSKVHEDQDLGLVEILAEKEKHPTSLDASITRGDASLSLPATSKVVVLDEQCAPLADAAMFAKSPLPYESPQRRSLRRTRSEHDSPRVQTETGLASPSARPTPLPPGSSRSPLQERRPNVQVPFKTPIKLQKSQSLSAVIEKTTLKQLSEIASLGVREQSEDNEKGPWTRDEAWDLFSWWPPSHEKPEFSAPTEPHEGTETGQATSFGPGFISAIHVR